MITAVFRNARARRALPVLALAVCLLAAASPSTAGARMSGARANRIALHLLGRYARLPSEVVLRLPQPVAARTRIAVADSPGRSLRLRRPAWLFWADLEPLNDLDHSSLLMLIDAGNGRLVHGGRLLRWPLVNGRLPAFLRSSAAYGSRRYRVLARAGGRTLRGSADLGSGWTAPRVQAGANRAPAAHLAAAAVGQCVIVVGPPPSFRGDWNWGEHYADSSAFTAMAEGLGVPQIYQAYNLSQLSDRIALAQSKGCSGITIFITGEGSAPPGWIDPADGSGPYPGNPRPNIEIAGPRIYAPDLAQVLSDRYAGTPRNVPAPKFTMILQGCFTGRFVPALSGVPGVRAVITSSAPNTESTRESNAQKLVNAILFSQPGPSPFVSAIVTGIKAGFNGSGGDVGAAGKAAFLNDVPVSNDAPELSVNGRIITKSPPAASCSNFHQPGCANFAGGIYDGGDGRAYAAGSLEIQVGSSGFCQGRSPCEFKNCAPACPHLDTAVPFGTRVTAVATPSTDSMFGRWDQGVCAGQGPTCTFTANYDSCITAEFLLTNPTAPPQTLPSVPCLDDPNYAPAADLSAADSPLPASPAARPLSGAPRLHPW